MRLLIFSLFNIFLAAPVAAEPARFAGCREVFAAQTPPVERLDTIETCRPGRDGASFAVAFAPARRAPAWAGYSLTRAQALTGSPGRLADFSPDPDLPKDLQARDADFRRSGFDRGHLVPSAVAGRMSPGAKIASYWYSNVAAQNPNHNRGLWAQVEAWVRERAKETGEIRVIVGTVFDEHAVPTSIGAGVAVPSHFFLTVYAPGDAKLATLIAENGPNATEDWRALDDLAPRLRALEARISELLPAERRLNVRGTLDLDYWALRR
ncbi:MAG: DNA/RNA non-specific endonuclease [Alphaproteobacteria bacterium]|nr:DNA/RNA non-specific endonuclease [Alphaproteobacteria bacterium]